MRDIAYGPFYTQEEFSFAIKAIFEMGKVDMQPKKTLVVIETSLRSYSFEVINTNIERLVMVATAFYEVLSITCIAL